jgi:hypothetical protein
MRRNWFEYHCYEGEDSNDAELWHHTHQRVKVIKKEQDCDQTKMYMVQFVDGFKAVVFDDEILSGPEENERSDYVKI